MRFGNKRSGVDTKIYRNDYLHGILWTKKGRTGDLPLAHRRPGSGPRGLNWVTLSAIGAGVVCAVALTVAVSLMNAAQRTVFLNNDGQLVEIRTTADTVEELLETQDIALRDCDTVAPGLDETLEDGETVRLNRGILVTIHTNGEEIQLRMPDGTVQDAIEEAGIELAEEDIVEPGLESSLLAGAYIRVVDVETETEYRKTTVPFKTVFKADPNLEEGKERVAQEGKNGVKKTAYTIVCHDGVKVGEEQGGDTVVEKPQDFLVYVGTKKPEPVVVASTTTTTTSSPGNTGSSNTGSSNTGSNNTGSNTSTPSKPANNGGNNGKFSYSNCFTVRASAYTHTGNRTASGKWPKVGMIAVDPRVIPLGTRVYVEGYGYATAEDTGDRYIKGNAIDLFMDTYDECVQWGLQRVKIYILD